MPEDPLVRDSLSLDRHHLYFFGDGRQEIAQHLLVLNDPGRMCWVWQVRDLAFFVCGGYGRLRLRDGSIKVSEKGSNTNLGKTLGLP